MSEPVSLIRWVVVVPDPVTGRLVPYQGEAAIPIEFTAPDKAVAERRATLNGIPPAAMVMSRLEYEELRRRPERPAVSRQRRHPGRPRARR